MSNRERGWWVWLQIEVMSTDIKLTRGWASVCPCGGRDALIIDVDDARDECDGARGEKAQLCGQPIWGASRHL